MSKHFIDAPKDIKQEDLKQLQDRIDLSKLYPTPAISAQMRDTTSEEPRRTIFPFSFSVFAGFLLVLPFILAGLLFIYLNQSIRASNVFFFLPLIVLSILAFVTLVIFIYRKISRKILDEGYDSLVILAFYASCLMCLVLPLYLLFSRVVGLYPIAVILLSILLIWVFLRIAASSKAGKVKNNLILIISGISLLISILYLISK